jgi:hypothetical protein
MRAFLFSFVIVLGLPALAQEAAPPPSSESPVVAPAPAPTPAPAPPLSSPSVMSQSQNRRPADTSAYALPRFLGVDLKFSGYFWADTGYMMRDNAQAGQYDQDVTYLQGRFVLAAGLNRQFGDWFGAARVEFLGLVNEFARSQYEPHTLDAWVRIGHQKWFDLQVGRFLAWEIYHRGQGIEFWTAEEAGALGGPALYWLDLTRGYRNESGQAAIHLYPFSFLKFEVASVFGQENNQNNLGIRPAAHLTLGGFQLLAGMEYLALRPQTQADKVQTTTLGYGGRAQYSFFNTVTVGANFAAANVEAIDIQGLVDGEKSLGKFTVGGFVDIDFWRNSIGLGFHHTQQLNKQNETTTHEQAFVSYKLFLPVEGLSVKAVYGFALAHIQDADTGTEWDNYVQSFRLRIAYDFN